MKSNHIEKYPADSLAHSPTAIASGKKDCFRSDKRFTCREACSLQRECKKLVAEWKR